MAILECTEGPSKGERYPIGDKPLVSFGREDDCTYQLRDPAVSRHHLQVGAVPGAGGHYAADYRTSNGTYVNGKRIDGKVTLKDGDQIRIGGTTLVYQLTTDSAPLSAGAKEKARKDAWAIDTLTISNPGRLR